MLFLLDVGLDEFVLDPEVGLETILGHRAHLAWRARRRQRRRVDVDLETPVGRDEAFERVVEAERERVAGLFAPVDEAGVPLDDALDGPFR
jgi:hypothetical protein